MTEPDHPSFRQSPIDALQNPCRPRSKEGARAMTDSFEKALTARDALVLAISEAGFGNARAEVAIQNLAKVGWKLVPYQSFPSPGPSGYSPDEFDDQNLRMGISQYMASVRARDAKIAELKATLEAAYDELTDPVLQHDDWKKLLIRIERAIDR